MANTPERLKKVEELFHAALALEAAARSSFLDKACGQDRELIEEVQSLISAHERESYFGSPARRLSVHHQTKALRRSGAASQRAVPLADRE